MDLHQITFPPGTQGIAEVVVGPTKRTYRTTTHNVAMALLGAQTEEQEAASRAGEITWTDCLSTHGVAFGTRGKRQYLLAVMPSRERTINYTGPKDPGVSQESRLTVTFPPILFGLCTEGTGANRFKKAVVFVLGSSDLSRLGVTGTANVAVAFPYGNVYAGEGRICWGSVSHAHIQSISDLEELFLGSDFNGDLYAMTGGRMNTLAAKYKGKALPLPVAPNVSVPGVIRSLAG